MNTNHKIKVSLLGLVIILLVILVNPRLAQAEDDYFCAVYFTGVGCPHCAATDPVLLEDWLVQYPNLVVIEYEVYHQNENGSVLYSYDQNYGTGLGIPMLILDQNNSLIGDRPILNNFKDELQNKTANDCLLLDDSQSFEDLDLTELRGRPKVWHRNRVLVSKGSGGDNQLIKSLLTSEDLNETLTDQDFEIIDPEPIALSGKNLEFERAIKVEGWALEWNGPALAIESGSVENGENDEGTEEKIEFTVAKIISLAAVDAINPCALAVLALMLMAIFAYNPTDRRNILLAGLAFILSVYVMYLIYGLIIVKSFELIQALTSVRIWLYKVLGILAIILGLLNIKDYFKYKSGSLGTEMPLFMRPRVKKIISGITRPAGAFGVGIFVTLFLLPCTIGPYIIAGGILSQIGLLKTLPWLGLYNLIFVLPMLIVVFLVYWGFKKIEDVDGWKDKNIRRLHLVEGVIMLALGIAIFFGLI